MDFYTYAYLREDGTPYYIGKGRGYRRFNKNRRVPVPDTSRILILKSGLTEEEAFRHEIYMIAVLGRKDKGTGILWNFTDGGEGASGNNKPKTEEHRRKISEAKKGKAPSKAHSQKIAASLKGRTILPDVREKISQALKGRPRPEEVRLKISEGNKKTKRQNKQP